MKYKICFYWISTLVKSFVVLPLLLRSSHPSVGTESTLKHIKDRFELGLILADVCIFLAVTRAQTPLSFEELFSKSGGGVQWGTTRDPQGAWPRTEERGHVTFWSWDPIPQRETYNYSHNMAITVLHSVQLHQNYAIPTLSEKGADSTLWEYWCKFSPSDQSQSLIFRIFFLEASIVSTGSDMSSYFVVD